MKSPMTKYDYSEYNKGYQDAIRKTTYMMFWVLVPPGFVVTMIGSAFHRKLFWLFYVGMTMMLISIFTSLLRIIQLGKQIRDINADIEALEIGSSDFYLEGLGKKK
jgi:predicted membrane channel-forming protein YqfA (hemolysin III family)